MAASRTGIVTLKAGREKSLRERHPWVYSGAIGQVDGDPGPGDTVEVRAHDGTFLAVGAFSPASQIRVRAWSFAPAAIDAGFLAARVRAAVGARAGMLDADHDACRLVHGESDGLPGVVADRYGDTVVVQMSSAGAERWRDAIVAALADATGAVNVVERSDTDVRRLEGLAPRTGVLRGAVDGPVAIREGGLRWRVDVLAGQKTGFYLDQRDNRRRVRDLARGRDVLNAFCYTGGFTFAALAGGAKSVLSIDSSAEALAAARANLARNAWLHGTAEWLEGDVFAALRRLREAGRRFDAVVLDPPKFAPTAKHAPKAARAYKDVNLWALKLLRPGGLLATFSCSGGIDAALFQKIVAGAALDAGADAVIEARLTASADHPVALAFPEGDYLKGLLVRRR